ncbi:hypothetical protein KC866_02485 [Patescibacteria group bacterium]|nr:hypothetical protein [Patescibacteria group bacterium]
MNLEYLFLGLGLTIILPLLMYGSYRISPLRKRKEMFAKAPWLDEEVKPNEKILSYDDFKFKRNGVKVGVVSLQKLGEDNGYPEPKIRKALVKYQ